MKLCFDETYFPIHLPENKKAGIVFSGGLDSTVLAKALLSLGVELDFFTIEDRCHVERVKKAAKYLGVETTFIKRQDVTSSDILNDVLALSKRLRQLLYTGATKNLDFQHSSPPKRPTNIVYPQGDYEKTLPFLYAPFINTTKDKVFKYADVLELDVSQTWSCTESAETLCGLCYACTERQLASKIYQENY